MGHGLQGQKNQTSQTNHISQSGELARVIGPITAVAVIVGSIIGGGIFKKPQAIAQNVQNFDLALFAWIIVGVLTLFGSLALAELIAMRPRAGGNYVFLKEGYGPIWGFLWGWVEFWILRAGSTAALATISIESLNEIIKATHNLDITEQKWATITMIACLGGVNVIGVRFGGFVQNVTTWLKVGALCCILILPFLCGEPSVQNLIMPGPAPKAGALVGFGAALLSVMWAYRGWMNLSPLGEELKEPQKYVSRVLFWGIGFVMLIYIAVNVAYAFVLSQSEIAQSNHVVAVTFIRKLFAAYGGVIDHAAVGIISVAIAISAMGSLNADILVGPRTYFALGRDGLFPKFFGKIHKGFGTPALAVSAQAFWAIVLVLVAEYIRESPAESPFDTLTDYVMFGAMIFETMVIAAVFRYRKLFPDLVRPYRCWGYPYIPAIFVAVSALVVINTLYDQPTKSIAGLVFISVGAIFYYAQKRFKTA